MASLRSEQNPVSNSKGVGNVGRFVVKKTNSTPPVVVVPPPLEDAPPLEGAPPPPPPPPPPPTYITQTTKQRWEDFGKSKNYVLIPHINSEIEFLKKYIFPINEILQKIKSTTPAYSKKYAKAIQYLNDAHVELNLKLNELKLQSQNIELEKLQRKNTTIGGFTRKHKLKHKKTRRIKNKRKPRRAISY